MAAPHSVVWDSCCFIDYLSNNAKGDRTDEEMAGLDFVADSIDCEMTKLVLPQSVFIEILETGIGEAAFLRFERFTQRDNVQTVDVNSAIARTAQSLRDAAARDGLKMAGMDSIFIATALLYEVHQLHTFDEKVLRFDGRFTIPHQLRKLTICRPGMASGDALHLPGLS